MRSFIAATAALLLAGCASMGQTRPVQSWSATLEPQGGTRVVGAARANSGRRETAVSVSIAGADAGSTHPWHIHSGTCASGGTVVGDAAAYPVLRVGANGQATATARIRVGLEPGGQYYVNIHKSPQEAGTIISCGQLR